MIDAYLVLQSGGQGCGDTLVSMAPLFLIFLIIWFLLIRPQRKQYEEHQEFLDKLKKGDEVVTGGGVFGKVEKLDDNEVRLRVDKETVLRVLKSEISGPASEAGDDEDDE
jgi:preprotein translocase subunit YajC